MAALDWLLGAATSSPNVRVLLGLAAGALVWGSRPAMRHPHLPSHKFGYALFMGLLTAVAVHALLY